MLVQTRVVNSTLGHHRICSCLRLSAGQPLRSLRSRDRGDRIYSLSAIAQPNLPSSIFDLASLQRLQLPAAVSDVYLFTVGSAECEVTPQLQKQFGLSPQAHQAQTVTSVTDIYGHQQVWFNRARSNKPQLFQQLEALVDPTVTRKHCDFCHWNDCTAVDPFGRVESEHVVTASNLFKYCEPCHGLVLFKHHHPLEFSQQQLAELLSCSQKWFKRAQDAFPEAHYPFFLWNCLPRAGASQFHGHAQLILTKAPLPCHILAEGANRRYETESSTAGSYEAAVLAAHQELRLVTEVGESQDRAFCFPCITPRQDMETLVQGSSLNSPAFQQGLYLVLRTMIDHLSMATFNVAITGMNAVAADLQANFRNSDRSQFATRVQARIVSRGKLSSQASDFGGLEVFGGASIGHTDPFLVASALQQAKERMQQALST